MVGVAAAAGSLLAGCSDSAPPKSQPTTSAPPSSTQPAPTANSPGTTLPGGNQAVATAAHPCGVRAAAVTYRHVIWIWMENHSYDAVIGAPDAPYLNQVATECGLATNYHNISHPSLPNYIAATSGLGLAALGPFVSDCSPSGSCDTNAPSIFGQGESWKAYEESMPTNCYRSDSDNYAVHHNPPPYFTALSGCATFDVPYGQLATDLAAGSLPAFSFVTPNVIDDMHDSSVGAGNTWLAHNLPLILDSPAYRSGTTAVFVTFDEGEGGSSSDCAANTTDVGCHVATIVVSPSTAPGTKSATLFNHYSLLATAEQLLGLPKLGLAGTFPTMVSAFNL
jgi:phospholipase C